MQKQLDFNSMCQLCNGTEFDLIEKETLYELLRCKRCGLISGRTYSIQSNYNAEYAENGAFQYKFEEARAAKQGKKVHLHYGSRIFFSKVMACKYTKKLLDVGCGSGTFLLQAKQRGFDVHGIEVSENAGSFISAELGLNLTIGSINNILKEKPEFLGLFDYVTSFEVLEHVNNFMEFLLSIKQVLKVGGMLFLSTPNWKSKYYQESRGWMNRPPIHTTFWDPSTLNKVLSKVGFSDIEVYKKPIAIGEFNNVKPKIKRIKKILESIVLDGIFHRTVGITMVVTAKKNP